MRIIRHVQSCPETARHAVVALGNFDGVHLGHQAILRQARRLAAQENALSAAMTFEPHPREVLGDGRALRLCSLRRKLELLRETGIDHVFLLRFDRRFASLSARAFVEDILHRGLAVRHVVTGENFAFGHKREGDTSFLAAQAQRLGFGFTACPPVTDDAGHVVSSSAIRAYLSTGNLRDAAALLGRPYAVDGKVERGDRRGRTIGFPTANIALRTLFRPRFGVYAVRVLLDGEWHRGVANLGIRPSFGGDTPLLEAHLFDVRRDLYGQRLRVEPVAFVREEKRFASLDDLKRQIAHDSEQAKEALHARGF